MGNTYPYRRIPRSLPQRPYGLMPTPPYAPPPYAPPMYPSGLPYDNVYYQDHYNDDRDFLLGYLLGQTERYATAGTLCPDWPRGNIGPDCCDYTPWDECSRWRNRCCCCSSRAPFLSRRRFNFWRL
ncbi:hypothetical protein Ciccas_007727 [Cichlidogyrus casuarinus]|uniref:Uncharacterized protein n=1 Tax=Cichlidogyrus casuarinus TaxID=1844966 RepID=A0ABD2Q374_9PLAT